MYKTQEDNLCRNIRRIAQGIERIVSALEKTNDCEKTEVIRCRDCKYWRNHKRLFCADTDADFFCGMAERKQV